MILFSAESSIQDMPPKIYILSYISVSLNFRPDTIIGSLTKSTAFHTISTRPSDGFYDRINALLA